MKKPAYMTPKEYAQYLNECCLFPYDEACRMAGYSPEDDIARQFWVFFVVVGGIGSLVAAVAYLPEALAMVLP